MMSSTSELEGKLITKMQMTAAKKKKKLTSIYGSKFLHTDGNMKDVEQSSDEYLSGDEDLIHEM